MCVGDVHHNLKAIRKSTYQSIKYLLWMACNLNRESRLILYAALMLAIWKTQI